MSLPEQRVYISNQYMLLVLIALVGSVMIFVSRKSGVVELTENLKNAGVSCK